MQKHIELESNGLVLRGYMHVPDKMEGTIPIVCMFHGFTGSKMEDHFWFIELSRKLEKEGIASLRFDFGNSGESDGEFINMTPEGEIIDAHNIIDFAYNLDFVDKDKVNLLGFSMGGMVAAIAANDKKDLINKLCLVSPAANLEEIFAQFFKEVDEQGQGKEVADINGLLFSKRAYEEMKTIDAYERAKGFDKNVLIVHGTKDEAVPINVGKNYKNIYKDSVSFFEVDGANHIYSYKQWQNSLIDKIIEFF